jgi:hypothetical protein
VIYVGDPAGKTFLESAGMAVGSPGQGDLKPDQILIVGPGCEQDLASRAATITNWFQANGRLLAIGLNQREVDLVFNRHVHLQRAEHISFGFASLGMRSSFAGISAADLHNRDPREVLVASLMSVDSVVEPARIVGDGVLAEYGSFVICQLAPWQFDGSKQANLKRTQRRLSFLVSRLLGNMGVASSTPLLDRFHRPLDTAKPEKRWLDSFYLDQPEEWDDPYRFFRW